MKDNFEEAAPIDREVFDKLGEPPPLAGTFTGFLQSLAEADVMLEIIPTQDVVTLITHRAGKQASVMISRIDIENAKADIASAELGDLINAVL